ncbi:MAG: S9 family peptidase [Chloroflexi bacterium]|nr:S9 family peptidase [Chloroflexota bacterium]
MSIPIEIKEKYERNGWPSLPRPDLKPPPGLSLDLLTSLERIRSHSLSSVGTIAYIKDGENNSDVYMLPDGGGWPGRITMDRTPVPYWDDEIPQWSPDGEWLAFSMKGHVHVLPRRGGYPKKITDFTTAASGPRWMPDSNGLVVTIERDEVDQLLLTDRDGKWPQALTTDRVGDHWDARPSPDGRKILFTLRRFDDLNRLDVVMLDLAGGREMTLYGKPSTRAILPKWSPSGDWIAFAAQETGWEELWLIRPDGEGLHPLTHFSHDVLQYEWSPDGSRILAVVNREGAFNLDLIEVDTGTTSVLSSGLGLHSNPQWSMDGSFITYEFESPSLPPDLYRMDVGTGKVTQLTFSTPPALQAYPFIAPEKVTYSSFDGLEIPALLYRPRKPNKAGILYPHGGPKDQYVYQWDDLAQYFTAKGYYYLAPNYRGSTGYGRAYERANYDDWGFGDAHDCLFGGKFIQALPQIDSERIAIAGGSYGGYLTVCALTRDPTYLFACGISKYGDANLISSWAQCEKRLRLYSEIFLGHPASNRKSYLKGSPILEIGQIRNPLLILHGLLDTIVPPQASEELVEILKREGKTFEYKTYVDEPHGFLRRRNILDVYARMERFLDWYLLPV